MKKQININWHKISITENKFFFISWLQTRFVKSKLKLKNKIPRYVVEELITTNCAILTHNGKMWNNNPKLIEWLEKNIKAKIIKIGNHYINTKYNSVECEELLFTIMTKHLEIKKN